jgi:hypothetical protein
MRKKRIGLGGEFLLRFNEAIDFLRKNPVIYAKIYKSFRKIIMKQFPYAIYYTVYEQEKEVEVLAIFYTGRSPKIIRKRLNLSK